MKGKIVKRTLNMGLAFVLLLSVFVMPVSATEGTLPDVNQEGITIDGNFEDWEGVPKTIITWNNQNNEVEVDHIGALYREGNTLYVLFREDAEYKYYDTPKNVLQVQNMELDVGFQVWPKVLKVLPVNDKGIIVGDAGAPMKDLENGVHQQFAVYVFQKNGGLVQVGTQVAYRVDKEASGHRINGDQIEFAIDLEKLAKYWDGNIDDIKTIQIKNHWLGDKWMILTGSSSYAITFLLIAVPIVIIGYMIYDKNKKKNAQQTS